MGSARIGRFHCHLDAQSPPDIGNPCRRGIRRYQQNGVPEASLSDNATGNGAAMLTYP